MKKEITLGQLLSVGVTVLLTIISGWITMNNKITKIEARQEMSEKRWEKIELKLDENLSAINQVKVELQNKKNRE